VGSTFSFTIPYELAVVITSRSSVKGFAATEKSLKDFSVLLVEDNDINRLYASSILKIWDCKIDIAENGYVAVEKIKNEDYDIVLMDIQMPVMDGLRQPKQSGQVLRLKPHSHYCPHGQRHPKRY